MDFKIPSAIVLEHERLHAELAKLEGAVTPDMAAILPMTDHLKAELPAMLAEHGEIIDALRTLTAVAAKEKCADALLAHLEMEEQVLGEIIRSRLGTSA